MRDTRREILTQVAAGTMTPAEAATRLDEVERAQSQAVAARVGAAAAGEIRGVRISNSYGRIVVLGDASVAQARVEGPHVARTENGLLVIGTDDSGGGNFWFGGREGGHGGGTFRWAPRRLCMNPPLAPRLSTAARGGPGPT